MTARHRVKAMQTRIARRRQKNVAISADKMLGCYARSSWYSCACFPVAKPSMIADDLELWDMALDTDDG